MKPPDLVRNETAMPRALINFTLQEATVDAKPSTDQQELDVTMALDSKFAYRLVDFNASLLQDVANDWLNRAYFEVSDAVRDLPAGSTQRHTVNLEDTRRNTSALEMWIARMGRGDSFPAYVIQSVGGLPIACHFFATNQTSAAGLAGTLDFFASFFEYEIEQVQRWPVHSPLLTYER